MRIGILYNPPESVPVQDARDRLVFEDDLEAVAAVEACLCELGHAPARLPLADDAADLLCRLRHLVPDLVFNLCESFRGRSLALMHVPALLDRLGLPYTGNDSVALGLSTDKALAKAVLANAGLTVPRHVLLTDPAEAAGADLAFPMIVKPLYEDGSYGISAESVVADPAALRKRAAFLISRFGQPALAEEYVDGREFTVAILGNDPPTVLPLSEIRFADFPPGAPKIVCYDAKWVRDSFEYLHTLEICPVDLPEEATECVRAVGLRAYRAIGCRDYATVDVRLDATNTAYVLEVNANPSITPDTDFIRSLCVSGRSYADLLTTLIGFATARRRD
jgi:D-alanine-D-alanine ligase